jgi:UDPglucose--hexose-1-phosphate uridylyltransferase
VGTLRTDELTGDQVIIAPARALRPDTFRAAAGADELAGAPCPFCAGHEDETPPEVARRGPGAPDTPGWRVRVVPNKYPIEPGAHEVVILSPAHDRDFGALDDDAVTEALLTIRDRAAFHLDRGAAYVQSFINHGRAAGASIAHPHAQLVALDAVPPRAQARVERFTAARFAADRAHMIVSNKVDVWCPPASTTPFALRAALANDGEPAFERASDADIGAMAVVLRDTIGRVRGLLGPVAYNVVFETAPPAHTGPFQWWADIIPRVSVPAGFELGTGVWVNIVDPADAARALKEHS